MLNQIFKLNNIVFLGMFLYLAGFVWTPSSQKHHLLLYLFMLLPFFFGLILNKTIRSAIKFNVLLFSATLFFLWSMLSILWSESPNSTGFELINYGKRIFIIYIFIFSVGWLVSQSRDKFFVVLRLSVIVYALAVAVSQFWHYVGLDFGLGYRFFRIHEPVFGFIARFYHPVDAGMTTAVFLITALFLLVSSSSGKILELLTWISLACLSMYLLNTWTRGAMIGVLFAFFVLVAFKRNKTSLILSVILLMFAVAFSLLFYDKLLAEFINRGVTGRNLIWMEYGWPAIKKSWWFGHGVGTIFNAEKYNVFHMHSYYMQQIHDSGLVGLFLFLLVILSLFYISVRYRTDPLMLYGLMLISSGSFVMIADIPRVLSHPDFTWLVIWWPFAIVYAAYINRYKAVNAETKVSQE